ncbi:hypothetical protein YC2023_056920 [Brassica napus]|uniref:Carbonic anhydrase n=2 Tax=Brassica napus TaxID=3708 RepID=A0A816KUM9_BRANA|nr:unnamed protein product [Brassica napus]
MESSSIQCIFFVFIVFTFISLSTAASSHGEVEDEHEFNYKKNDGKGPERWGEIKQEWEMCGKGEIQSPIDLMNERVKIVSHLGRLIRDYEPSNATIKNRGHDIMLKFEDGAAGSIKINGFQYELQQLHWHSPSEHTINGRRFALELHMVHEGKKGRMAVVTVLYKIGRADTFIRSLEKELEAITDLDDAEKHVRMIDPKQIKIGSRKYYRYIGSLTTPPCTQNVTWSVVRKIRTVTREQVRLLRVAVHDDSLTNARPVQPINKRVVHLYRPRTKQEMESSPIQCIFFVFIIFTLFSFSTAATSHGEVEDEHEFNYKKNDDKGPERWGEIKPEWEMCGKGELQSPIDLMNERVKIVSHLGRLIRDYEPSNATIKNRGHDIMLKFKDGAGSIKINGFHYELQQLHWHSPSEHTVNGRRFALELHMVHEGKNGRMAVVTVLYKIGRADTFIRSLEKELEAITDLDDAEKHVRMIDPKQIKIGSRKYYRYIGSLTTPPCTQNVTWSVVRKIRTVTREQVRLLRVAVHDDSLTNARPVQPINKRMVHLYRPRV